MGHGWTRINTDGGEERNGALIRVHPWLFFKRGLQMTRNAYIRNGNRPCFVLNQRLRYLPPYQERDVNGGNVIKTDFVNFLPVPGYRKVHLMDTERT